MAFDFSYFCMKHNFWLGIDPKSERHVLGIPVSNPMVTTSTPAGWKQSSAYPWSSRPS